MYLLVDPEGSLVSHKSDIEVILNSKVKFIPQSYVKSDFIEFYRRVLLFQNVSVSLTGDLVGMTIPEKVVVGNKPRARKSKICEFVMMVSGKMMNRNDPFLHVISDIMWRFGESGIKKETVQQRHLTFNLMKYLKEVTRESLELPDEQVKSLSFENLWIFVFASTFTPIAVLIIELIVNKNRL